MSPSALAQPVVRATSAPAPNACRWCGVVRDHHGTSFARSVGFHVWAQPTVEQVRARYRARRTGS